MKDINSEIQNIFGNIKVITIGRNFKKQEAIHNFLADFKYEMIIDVDMTVNYLEYKYVRDLPAFIFDKYDLDKEYCSRWSKGQFGCFATEKGILLEHFNKRNKENLTIVLDDALPLQNWKNNLIRAYNELPNNWHALILGTHLQNETKRYMRPFVRLKRFAHNIIFNKKFTNVRKCSKNLDYARGDVAGIYGIIYSYKGILKLFAEPEKLRKDQDDVLLSRLIKDKYFNAYIAYPQVFYEGIYDESWTQKNEF